MKKKVIPREGGSKTLEPAKKAEPVKQTEKKPVNEGEQGNADDS